MNVQIKLQIADGEHIKPLHVWEFSSLEQAVRERVEKSIGEKLSKLAAAPNEIHGQNFQDERDP